MIVRKALIIDSPWIEKILAGDKTWEIRSGLASHRGPFGLIQKVSGQLIGVATLHSVSGPYKNTELAQHRALRHVPPNVFEQPNYKWRYAWELSDAIALPSPVSYHHKSGSVTWVDLDDSVVHEIALQFGHSFKDQHQTSAASKSRNNTFQRKRTLRLYLPIARDCTVFSRECGRRSTYTLGEKGDEQRFNNFYDALNYLRSMPTAKWPRPNANANANGNWGIVSAIDWVEQEQYEATA